MDTWTSYITTISETSTSISIMVETWILRPSCGSRLDRSAAQTGCPRAPKPGWRSLPSSSMWPPWWEASCAGSGHCHPPHRGSTSKSCFSNPRSWARLWLWWWWWSLCHLDGETLDRQLDGGDWFALVVILVRLWLQKRSINGCGDHIHLTLRSHCGCNLLDFPAVWNLIVIINYDCNRRHHHNHHHRHHYSSLMTYVAI